MMGKIRTIITIIIIYVALITGCVEPYAPPEMAGYENLLVVSGILDAEAGTCEVVLSRTQPLNKFHNIEFENDAQIMLISEAGESHHLSVRDNKYQVSGLIVNMNQRYRLKITDVKGNIYESDQVTIKATPEIDSVLWKFKPDGIQIYVNTHDPNDDTWYYKWTFEETWEYTTRYYSAYIFDLENDVLEPRLEDIYRCWRSNQSKEIIVGTSNKLKKDIINEFPITFVPGESSKLYIKYSILVKQHALTKETYQFWNLMERNSENLGSIFDPQPAIIKGNIRCTTNPDVQVIGYFQPASVKSKRLFILGGKQMSRWRQNTGYTSCFLDTVIYDERYRLPNFEIVDIIQNPEDGEVSAFVVTNKYCADCRFNGTNTKPEYWNSGFEE